MNQNSIELAVSVETLANVPEHVLKGLPEEVRLLPSAVDKTRLGVWATKPIFKGRKFGPFVGDKKKRSQVKSNVYMWEVYYPNLGWMCVDATDPEKGNWLRYVNWACSGKEQNLFPLEINRTIYYKTLKPIEPGEELLVWYNGEDNPEIAAAIEEERASNRSKKNSPKAKKGKKKLSQEAKRKAIDKKQKTVLDSTPADMREPKEDHKQEDETPSVSAILSLDQTAVIQEMVNQDSLPDLVISSPVGELHTTHEEKSEAIMCGGNVLEEEEEEEEEEEQLEEDGEDPGDDDGEEEEEEEDVSSPKQSPEVEPLSMCEDKLDEQSSISEESPESSPKKKPVVKFPKTRGESNGSIQGTFMFPCQHCERKFTTKQGLERHMHIHISAVSHAFKCRYCGKAFGTQINRRRHERRHEAGPKRKPFLMLASTQLSSCSAKSQISAEDGVKDEANAKQDFTASEMEKASLEIAGPVLFEESKEPKELHPCKYCKKVFGTHTNMRRHQRRVHERHLIPKGVRRKPEEPQLPAEQSQQAPNVYVANTDPEEEGEADDVYIMDVSSNISENLNYYIDGKIQSNNSTSNCEVIEVESSSAELYGINCLLSPVTVEISPNLKATPVHLVDVSKESPVSGNGESKKRRTASPPLLPKIKTEMDPEPITSLCSLTIPLTISTAENLPFPKEKSIYLSSKLKQLLQTQDSNKVVPSSPSTEVPKLGPPGASSPLLSSASSRFKRRTSSPPSSPQHSPALRDFSKVSEGKSIWTDTVLGSKIPKLESHSNSPAWSLSGREEKETVSPLCLEEYKISKDWTPSPPFGNVCNQQPLDLSSSVKQKSNCKNRTQVPWESVLDLSIHKKTCNDTEAKETNLAQPTCSSVRKKPTTSMLQKVLLNEYNGTDLTQEDSAAETNPSLRVCKLAEVHPEPPPNADLPLPALKSGSPNSSSAETLLPSAPTVSSCQLPPLLTPTNSPSPPPCPPMLKVATPPPPLLPTVPSPPPEESVSVTPSSCPSPLSNTTAQSPLPILSPTVSASPVPSIQPPNCASPGPPNLSSSSSSFCSSSSSSSSSSSPSPPPLSVVSSVLSPGDNLENSAPMIPLKQEELESEYQQPREDPHSSNEADIVQETFNKNFVCNVCESPFLSIKDLTKHLSVHAEEWPFKCEFCVQLFREKTDLSEHRFLLHGVGNIFVCSVCKKEFAFLCNLQQHQRDLHPDTECTHHEFESGTLRPQNFTDPSKASIEHMQILPEDSSEPSKEEEEELNDSSEELYTTIKIMASGVKSKDPDVRMGLNQHYPSFKPPPFQYHHRNPNGIGVTATNFTTHNIPQTFTTAIRCTKCGKSVDNMPELHKHILACASASDKKRYTPKKNPVPLKQTIRPQNGVVLSGPASNTFRRMGQPKRLNFSVEVSRMSSNKLKISALKKKNQLVQKAILHKKKSQQKAELRNSTTEPSSHICPYCNREFTYIGSLNKHASYSCPKKPVSPPSKKNAKNKSRSVGSDRSSNQRRRTADAEIKMQSTQAHLGKTRARSSGPTSVQLPSASFKLKQNVKFVPPIRSKKQSVSSAARNASPLRVAKITPPESKRVKGVSKSSSSGLSSKTSRKLHVRIQRNKVALASKSTATSKKKADRFSMKSRERVGGPVTRSLQQTSSTDTAESKREETSTRQELKDFRNLL